MEAGVPIPVPSDLMMLLLGERVSAGALPLWLAMVALELVALAGTAALFLAAASSGIRVGRALPALVLGSSVFPQA
jgi:membrane protein DedA with SNARE-associated domain